MANPGYVMVDFTGVDLYNRDPVTIVGIYKRAREVLASGKPCYACNLVMGTTPVSPMPVTAYEEAYEEAYVVFTGFYQLRVSEMDVVTFNG